MKKYLGKTGYTLHAKRAEYVGGKIKRTIKYPLRTQDQELFNSLSGAIHHDSIYLDGIGNIDQYLSHQKVYSLLDFWLDSLRAGVIFQQSTAEMFALIHDLSNIPNPYVLSFNTIPEDLRNKLIEVSFIKKVFLKSVFKTTSTPKSIKKQLLEFVKDDFKNDKEITNIIENTAHSIIGKSKIEQNEILAKAFGYTEINSENISYSTTFYIYPSLNLVEGLTPLDAISRITALNNDTENLLGIGSNGNALSNYFNAVINDLRNSNTQKYFDEMLSTGNLWVGNEAELQKRLDFLSNRAKLLPQPMLATTWAEYRSVFSGKLKSWYSNYNNYLAKSHEQIIKQKSELQELLEEVQKSDLKDLESLILIALEAAENTTNIDVFNTYVELLGNIKSLTNRHFQSGKLFYNKKYNLAKEIGKKNKGNKKDNTEKINQDEHLQIVLTEITIDKILPNLFKKVQYLPKFYGESKKELNSKYINFAIRCDEAFKIVEIIKNEIMNTSQKMELVESDYFIYQLEKLSRLHNKLNTNMYKNKVEKILVRYCGKIPNKKYEIIYKSKYSKRENRKILNILMVISDFNTELEKLYNELDDTKDWKNLNSAQRIDYIEMKKLTTSWFVHLHNFDFIELNITHKYFDHLKNILFLTNGKLDKNAVFYILNSILFSEVRGIFNQTSRKTFNIREVAQVMNSEKKFPIYYSSNKDETKYAFFVGFPNLNTKNQFTELEIYNVKKTVDKSPNKFKIDENSQLINLFQIKTSRYQRQFLEWFMSDQKRKGKVHITRDEPQIVKEITYNADCNFLTGKIELIEISQSIYFNQPFNINPNEKPQINKNIEIAKKYLGLDIGEYGVAYYVLSAEGALTTVDTGFIYSAEIRKIRDHIDIIKNQQITGTFTVPNSALSRIRKSAQNGIRNRIHDLVLKYDAKPIYEHEISAFETAGNRVAKIYHSIKKTDVIGRNDADKSEREKVWGKNQLVGNHISAYGTSQTCSKCRRSPLKYIDTSREYKTSKYVDSSNIYKADINGQKLLFFSKDIIGPNIPGSKLKTCVYEFMRPPKDAEYLKINNLNFETFYENRGNSALFICPFIDCQNISDADVQAALNIAYKGYLSDLDKTKKLKVKSDFFVEIAKEFEFPTVSLIY